MACLLYTSGYSRDAAEAVRLAKRLLQIQEKESLEEKKA